MARKIKEMMGKAKGNPASSDNFDEEDSSSLDNSSQQFMSGSFSSQISKDSKKSKYKSKEALKRKSIEMSQGKH